MNIVDKEKQMKRLDSYEQRACNPLKSGKDLKHINWHCVKHDLLAGNIGHLLVMANMWMSQEFSRELWS